MSRNYNDFLRLTYEIEGLLLLQSQRADGDTVSAVDNMIAEKTALLAKAFPLCPDTLTTEEEPAGCPAAESTDREATAASALDEEEMRAAEPVEHTPAGIRETSLPKTSSARSGFRERARDIFRAFTLNDKFRFRRELFRNSQDEFDDTLNVISQMSSITEAEEYIYDDLCWDPDNEDVKAFMDVVAKHF